MMILETHKIINAKKEIIYKCPECGFFYKEKEWAQKCEKWCKKYKSCNLKITERAVKFNNINK